MKWRTIMSALKSWKRREAGMIEWSDLKGLGDVNIVLLFIYLYLFIITLIKIYSELK